MYISIRIIHVNHVYVIIDKQTYHDSQEYFPGYSPLIYIKIVSFQHVVKNKFLTKYKAKKKKRTLFAFTINSI